MKHHPLRSPLAAAAAGLWLAFAGPLLAQDFNSGSNGSFGPLVVSNSTTVVIDLPPDGILHCTTVTVGFNATLRFKRNALNTPVHLLAQGAVVVDGTIDVSGKNPDGPFGGQGGPGGFDGGDGGFGPTLPASRGGDGHGPGRGINANGMVNAAHATASGGNAATYGNSLCLPLIGGSGGSGGSGNPGGGGGGGGGAILIASSTSITLNGSITARSGGGTGLGSAGAIRLVAPTGGGSGFLNASGFFAGAGVGRLRLDTTDRLAFRSLSFQSPVTRGTRMFVFPPVMPKLHLVEAAGQTIPVGAPAGVTVELPAGSPTSQTVRLRGEGFTGIVPVRIVVTPEHSPSSSFDLDLDGSGNPAEVSTQVILPIGEPTRIEAWTR